MLGPDNVKDNILKQTGIPSCKRRKLLMVQTSEALIKEALLDA